MFSIIYEPTSRVELASLREPRRCEEGRRVLQADKYDNNCFLGAAGQVADEI